MVPRGKVDIDGDIVLIQILRHFRRDKFFYAWGIYTRYKEWKVG